MNNKTKTCRKCGEEKTFDCFNKNKRNKDGLHIWCRTCTKAADREYSSKNREKACARAKQWYKDNTHRAKEGIKVWQHTKEDLLKETSTRLINYTVNKKTDYYAWYYTHPKDKSPITHDNYHTGGILDGILEYFEETGDERFTTVYWKGLAYYKENLFEKNGAPRWMNHKKYPFDVHGSAQGILTFAKAARHKPEYSGSAETIAAWAIDNLYSHEKKEFIYRKGRFYSWNYSLMRWCNAWMARGLAALI